MNNVEFQTVGEIWMGKQVTETDIISSLIPLLSPHAGKATPAFQVQKTPVSKRVSCEIGPFFPAFPFLCGIWRLIPYQTLTAGAPGVDGKSSYAPLKLHALDGHSGLSFSRRTDGNQRSWLQVLQQLFYYHMASSLGWVGYQYLTVFAVNKYRKLGWKKQASVLSNRTLSILFSLIPFWNRDGSQRYCCALLLASVLLCNPLIPYIHTNHTHHTNKDTNP